MLLTRAAYSQQLGGDLFKDTIRRAHAAVDIVTAVKPTTPVTFVSHFLLLERLDRLFFST